MVVEDVPADDSPLRPALAPVVRVRCRRRHPGVRCGRKCPECDDGGGDGDGATRTSAAMGSSSWAWRRARRARSMAWWSPECRGRSRAAGSPGISGWGMRGRWRPPTRRPWADSHASRAGRPAISRAGSPPAWNPRCRPCSTVSPRWAWTRPATGRGHTCITVAVDHKRERVVRAHDGYGKEALGPFFRQPTDERRASIRIDADDGAEWIDAGVRKHPPNAGRFLDPFRIVSRMSDALDQVRKRLRNQARCGNDKTATGATRDVRYAVLKNPEDLAERPDTALAALGDTDPRGRPYRSWQPKELPRDAPAPARRTSRGRSGTMDLPGLTQPHPRDRRTMRKDPRTRGRHPRGHLTRPLQRRARGIQRQDQDHHPHGLRLPPRRQSHRHDQTPMQRPTHPPANTHPLTHENSRRL